LIGAQLPPERASNHQVCSVADDMASAEQNMAKLVCDGLPVILIDLNMTVRNIGLGRVDTAARSLIAEGHAAVLGDDRT
jgi:hypothetical protein